MSVDSILKINILRKKNLKNENCRLSGQFLFQTKGGVPKNRRRWYIYEYIYTINNFVSALEKSTVYFIFTVFFLLSR